MVTSRFTNRLRASDSLIKDDEFAGTLWRIYQEVKREGYVQVRYPDKFESSQRRLHSLLFCLATVRVWVFGLLFLLPSFNALINFRLEKTPLGLGIHLSPFQPLAETVNSFDSLAAFVIDDICLLELAPASLKPLFTWTAPLHKLTLLLSLVGIII
jgi:hypothetical protein